MTDLWVTFEIREHGELGAYASACARAFGVKVTKTSGLPDVQLSSWSFFFFSSFCIYLFVWLCHVLVASSGIFSCGMRDLFPDQGSNPDPLHQKCRVSAAGPPEKSLLTLSQYSLFSCLSWDQKTLGFSPQRRGLFLLCPGFKCWRDLGLNPRPSSFLCVFPWVSSSISVALNATNKLAPNVYVWSRPLL